jgi:hypothetical protein
MRKTKRDFYNEIKAMVTDPAQVAFIDAQIAAIDARNIKAQEKRAEKKSEIASMIQIHAVDVLTDAGRAITLAELVAGIGNEVTSAQVVYHIRPLIEDGTIVKEKVKVGSRKIMSYKVAE